MQRRIKQIGGTISKACEMSTGTGIVPECGLVWYKLVQYIQVRWLRWFVWNIGCLDMSWCSQKKRTILINWQVIGLGVPNFGQLVYLTGKNGPHKLHPTTRINANGSRHSAGGSRIRNTPTVVVDEIEYVIPYYTPMWWSILRVGITWFQ